MDKEEMVSVKLGVDLAVDLKDVVWKEVGPVRKVENEVVLKEVEWRVVERRVIDLEKEEMALVKGGGAELVEGVMVADWAEETAPSHRSPTPPSLPGLALPPCSGCTAGPSGCTHTTSTLPPHHTSLHSPRSGSQTPSPHAH